MTDWSGCLPPSSAQSGGGGKEEINRTSCSGVVSVSEIDRIHGSRRESGERGNDERNGGNESEKIVRFSASLGVVRMAPEQTKLLPFDLIVTPLKPFNLSQHFNTRYWCEREAKQSQCSA